MSEPYQSYTITVWRNYPNTSSPIDEDNLSNIEQGIKNLETEAFARISATNATLATAISSITFNSKTGQFTINYIDSTITPTVIDTDLEKIAINFDYDDDPTSPHYQNIIITLDDGDPTAVPPIPPTVKYIDLSALITEYEFVDTSTIGYTVAGDGKISSYIKNYAVDPQTSQPVSGISTAMIQDGAITDDKIESGYLAQVTAQATIATESRKDSEAWAVGTKDGQEVPSTAPQYHNNASYWASQAHTDATSIQNTWQSMQYREVAVASSDWELNYNPASNTDYPYICRKLVTDVLPLRPEWRMASTNVVPIGNEIKAMSFVLEAFFGVGDNYYTDATTYTPTTDKTIMLYATTQPTVNLKLMYKGV